MTFIFIILGFILILNAYKWFSWLLEDVIVKANFILTWSRAFGANFVQLYKLNTQYKLCMNIISNKQWFGYNDHCMLVHLLSLKQYFQLC